MYVLAELVYIVIMIWIEHMIYIYMIICNILYMYIIFVTYSTDRISLSFHKIYQLPFKLVMVWYER